MDINDIEFDKSLLDYYAVCLNGCYVRKDRLYCWCDLHKSHVSKKQSKNRKCFKCSHKKEISKEVKNWTVTKN